VASEKVLQGYETFKWKIGVEPVEAEQAIFGELATRLPEGARLRLDANGGLSVECLESWLSFLQAHRGRVDYLEQPLAVGEEAVMARCSEASGIPIALDESLHGADGLRWLEARAWPGPLVVKPALAGVDRASAACCPAGGAVFGVRDAGWFGERAASGRSITWAKSGDRI
jgi:O-succinylbenzoate synthase